MKLEFRLLIVDDEPDSITAALAIFYDHLKSYGFDLNKYFAKDFSTVAIKALANDSGRNFDLVMVDYNLGGAGQNGAGVASELRRQLPFTDIVFYSSDPGTNLFQECADKKIQGIFIANRDELGSALKGIADTVIGKAVDLNHMRGIAMAEVAELDVLMEETLIHVFSSTDSRCISLATETLLKLLESAKENVVKLEPIEQMRILDLLGDSHLFGSAQKYFSIMRLAKHVTNPTTDFKDSRTTLNNYVKEIIKKRNTLAHAREERTSEGGIAVRSNKRGEAVIEINDVWMIDFRKELQVQRSALDFVCKTLISTFPLGA